MGHTETVEHVWLMFSVCRRINYRRRQLHEFRLIRRLCTYICGHTTVLEYDPIKGKMEGGMNGSIENILITVFDYTILVNSILKLGSVLPFIFNSFSSRKWKCSVKTNFQLLYKDLINQQPKCTSTPCSVIFITTTNIALLEIGKLFVYCSFSGCQGMFLHRFLSVVPS